MNVRRNRSAWVLEPEARVTINQKIGGLLYDFSENRFITLSNNRKKLLLSCIREETGMSDYTLRRIFKGQSDSLSQFMCVIAAIIISDSREWLSLAHLLTTLIVTFVNSCGDDFLEEQRLQRQPKHKPLNP